jgi:DNA-binding NtrC family response regulator
MTDSPQAGHAPDPDTALPPLNLRDTITILVVDDEQANRESLEKIFVREGMRVLLAEDARAALDQLRSQRVHVLLTDLMMPGISGLELLRAAKQLAPAVEVVLMTAYGTVETAVAAMREGAYDFVEKPLRRINIVKSVRKAAERGQLLAENQSLRNELKLLTGREIVGTSTALRSVTDIAAQAAPSTATVLILGESGTGKELIARYLHERSQRARGPFVAVNCGAIPENMMESELFGHERGAYTGAVTRKDGRFAKATAGTLFLDEVGELPLAVQVKLLRVLQEAEFEPLGGTTTKSDVRIVAATNRDLAVEVREGRFREDLYYRLNVIAITAPPLRARPEDVPLLVDHFLRIFCVKNAKPLSKIGADAMAKLVEYPWPGNVRELENVIERAVVLSRQIELDVSDLPQSIRDHRDDSAGQFSFPVGITLAEVELRLIRETLRRTKGDKVLAAHLLGISARTIYRKVDGTDGGVSDVDGVGR